MRWRSYVALGDSFTEGMDDPYEDGRGYRGWADLVAAQLATGNDEFRYANLAVRGRLFPRVVEEQVPAALAMNVAGREAAVAVLMSRTHQPASPLS